VNRNRIVKVNPARFRPIKQIEQQSAVIPLFIIRKKILC